MTYGWLGPEAIKKRNFLSIPRQLCNSMVKGAACLQKCPHVLVLNWDCNSSALRPVTSKYKCLLGSIFVESAFVPAAASLQMSTNSVSHSLLKAVPGNLPSCQGTEQQHRAQTLAWGKEQEATQPGGNASVVNSTEVEVGQCRIWTTSCREMSVMQDVPDALQCTSERTCTRHSCPHREGHRGHRPRPTLAEALRGIFRAWGKAGVLFICSLSA